MKIPNISLPRYEITLPVSGQKVKFRPFLVREEKVLLLALQEDDIDLIITTISNVARDCTNGDVDVDELSQIDVEYLFLSIRNKSMGEGVPAVSTCSHCGNKNDLVLDFSTVKVSGNQNKEAVIKLSEDSWISMKFPSIKVSSLVRDVNDIDQVMTMIASCVDYIIIGDTKYSAKTQTLDEIREFLEDMSQEQFKELGEFFEDLPRLVFEHYYDCEKCNEKNRVFMEGLESFFV